MKGDDMTVGDRITDMIIDRLEAERRFYDVLGSWIEGWGEEHLKVIRLQERLQKRCLGCALAIDHGVIMPDFEGYREMQADIVGFYDQMEAESR